MHLISGLEGARLGTENCAQREDVAGERIGIQERGQEVLLLAMNKASNLLGSEHPYILTGWPGLFPRRGQCKNTYPYFGARANL